ncbi:MAG: Na/Pi symporter [Cyclobacteriaceae bacterium]
MTENLIHRNTYKKIPFIVLVIGVFLIAINLMATAFSYLGEDIAQSILFATANPFIGLFIGLLMTAIIQSSSTSTSMTVAAVASGSISFEGAIPIIMGANIGTTLTSTIIALGYITKKKEFERAVSAGVIHDIFNIFCVILLFPLEYNYQLLSRFATQITRVFFYDANKMATEEVEGLGNIIFDPISSILYEWVGNPYIMLIIAFLLIFGAIKMLSKIFYNQVFTDVESNIESFIFPNPFKSFAIGTIFTAIIQTSSLSTSLMVPVVATKRVSLQKAFQFIMGANVGTTITALIAAIFKSEEAIAIAIVHLLFNLIGILIFLPFKSMRQIPVQLAKWFGHYTAENRIIGFLYILFMFFIIPFTLIYFNRGQ